MVLDRRAGEGNAELRLHAAGCPCPPRERVLDHLRLVEHQRGEADAGERVGVAGEHAVAGDEQIAGARIGEERLAAIGAVEEEREGLAPASVCRADGAAGLASSTVPGTFKT